MELFEAILGRRSVRKFQPREISRDLLLKIIEAGRWAPSGMNNQPWRFVLVQDKTVKDKISSCTAYAKIINSASCLIAVFIDADAVYNRDKDMQAIGACMENMLLMAFALGLGGCWLGEILNKKTAVAELLAVPPTYELAAVLAMGYPDEAPRQASRKKLKELLIKEIK